MNTKFSPIKRKVVGYFIDFLKTLRPILGFPYVCVYPVGCMQYAESMLLSKPWYCAIVLIFMRLLSCNPITALYHRMRSIRNNS